MPEGPEIRRAGAPCRLCRRTLEAAPIGGRKCFWCPACQPAAARTG